MKFSDKSQDISKKAVPNNNQYFDWRWGDESANSDFQLIIPRRRGKADVIYREGYFIEIDSQGNQYSQADKYYLKTYFEAWYNLANVIDVEAFLEYHYQAVDTDKGAFLRYVRAIIQAMMQTNEWELNFEGKRQLGLNWVNEKMKKPTLSKPQSSDTTIKSSKNKLTFDTVFRRISSAEFTRTLQRHEYLNEDDEWLLTKSDLKGLVHFLIEKDYTKLKHKAPLYRILTERIKYDPISKIDGHVNSEYITQYNRLFPNH